MERWGEGVTVLKMRGRSAWPAEQCSAPLSATVREWKAWHGSCAAARRVPETRLTERVYKKVYNGQAQ
jgi:hypothetical protein